MKPGWSYRGTSQKCSCSRRAAFAGRILATLVCLTAFTACIGPIKPVPSQQSQEAPPPPTETAEAPKPVEPAPSDTPPSVPSVPAVQLPPIGVGQPSARQEKEEMPVVEAKPVLVAASRESYVVPNATSGTKTNTPIMDTPLNVQVIAQQVLKDQQVITLDQALKNVSGVTTNTTNNFAGNLTQSILLRGFASQTFFRNGFRLQEGAASRAMANVESIEVLKGPAAILYGLVEPGGMINVLTKQPLATPYYSLNQQFGSYDFYRTTMDATGPLTKDDTLLYRLNVSYQNSGSFRDFVDKKDIFLAPVLKWNIGPRTQATFEFEYNHQKSGLDFGFVPLLDGKILNIPRSRNYGERTPVTTQTFFGGVNWSHQFTNDWSIKHSVSVNQQSVKQPSLVFPFDVTSGSVSRLLQSFDTKFNTYSTNVDLIGHFDTVGFRHTLLIGGDYYRLDTITSVTLGDVSTIDLFNPVHPGTPFSGPLQPLAQNANRTDQYSFYIQDQIQLPYNIHVMGGFRYQHLRQNNNEEISQSSNTAAHDAVTPRVGVVWRPQQWLSLYGNYAENFGPNDPFAVIFPGTLPPPTSAKQYEGGIKTEFFGGRLRATLAYYDLTKTNIATRDPLHPTFSIVTGAARSRGPELDINGEILPGWNVIATYANTEARITRSNDDSASSPTSVGSRFFNVPRNTGSVWTTYEVLTGELRGMKIGGGVTMRDGQPGCCDKPAASIPGYALVDLLAAYSRTVGQSTVTAQLNVYNLLDQHYFSGLTTNGVGLNGLTGAYADFGQPRMFIGSIKIQY
ncbi:MAG: TonB-dependent siderophore receptor [Nitrospiraceae bacterium]|nr:TonB-dependent siderophore receptor [Nitrospiraceae bacterium]